MYDKAMQFGRKKRSKSAWSRPGLLLIMIVSAAFLAGCGDKLVDTLLPAQKETESSIVEKGDKETYDEIAVNKGGTTEAGRVIEGERDKGRRRGEIDPEKYYSTQYDPKELIYCGKDPELRKMDTDESMMKSFNTLQEAEHYFPRHKLRMPCDSFELKG